MMDSNWLRETFQEEALRNIPMYLQPTIVVKNATTIPVVKHINGLQMKKVVSYMQYLSQMQPLIQAG